MIIADAIGSLMVRLMLIAALFAGSLLVPSLTQFEVSKRTAAVNEASEFAATPQVAAIVKKFAKPLRQLKKLTNTAVSYGTRSMRYVALYAGAAVMLYPCVRLLRRRILLMPIKFTSAFVARAGRFNLPLTH